MAEGPLAGVVVTLAVAVAVGNWAWQHVGHEWWQKMWQWSIEMPVSGLCVSGLCCHQVPLHVVSRLAQNQIPPDTWQ